MQEAQSRPQLFSGLPLLSPPRDIPKPSQKKYVLDIFSTMGLLQGLFRIFLGCLGSCIAAEFYGAWAFASND